MTHSPLQHSDKRIITAKKLLILLHNLAAAQQHALDGR
jgi:hypothetical protein